MLSRPGTWTGFVLDVGLPDGSGLDLLADARTKFPATPALVLTGRTEASSINAAFDLNADYVVKPIAEARVRHFLDVARHPARARRAAPSRGAAPSAGSDPLQRCIEHLRVLLSQPADPLTRHAIGAAIADIKARRRVRRPGRQHRGDRPRGGRADVLSLRRRRRALERRRA